MWVPLSWLGEWVDLPADVEALAERLTLAGLEVDSIERRGPDLEGIVVGHVLACEPHPDADRLRVCRVDLGAQAPGGEPVTIVCGAPNVAAGQKVAVAPPGVRLQGRKLKKSKIRGVVSQGMICSEQELGLSQEHDGILVLDTDAPAGAPLEQVLGAGETVLEVAITANRGDCASIVGIAREVRAAFGGALRWPAIEVPEGEHAVGDDIAVAIEDAAGCFHYAARVVRGVRVGPSPEWLKRRLEAVNLRPLNVVVDVTNYVLHELGQPLHAFDLAKLEGARVAARRAREGERITTLDGAEHALAAEDLVIADARGPVAIAGVMGGANSEVDAGTTDILLESAHFHPSRVRRTARRLGLHTEASYRFERGIDRAGVVRALDRAAQWIARLAGGSVSSGVAEARGDAPDVVETILLDPARVNRVLGTALDADAIAERLGRLEIESAPEGATLRCHVPTHRNDLRIEVDLVEEVARMHGLDAIAPRVLHGPLTGGTHAPALALADALRDALCAEGWTEIQTLPFLDPAELDRLGLADDDPRRATVPVRNPIVESESQLRPLLAPTLLRVARENTSRQVERLRVFEVCRVFTRGRPGELPDERWEAGALLLRSPEPSLWEPPADAHPVPLFFEAKGAAERLFARLGRSVRFGPDPAPEPWLHPGACAAILAGKRRIGVVGELHPALAARSEITVPAAVLTVDLSAVGDLPIQQRRYRALSRHPLVRRDLAILVDADQPAAELVAAIEKKAGAMLQRAEVFDRYTGEGVPQGKVSLAIRLVFQHPERTLTDEEVTRAVDAVRAMLAHRFGAEQR